MSEVIQINNVRLSYPKLAEPKRYKDDPSQPLKYSCEVILNKKDHLEFLKKIESACLKIAINQSGGDEVKGKQMLATFKASARFFLRSGILKESKDPELYNEDSYFINFSENRKPQYIDENVKEIPIGNVADKFYPGCYVNILIKPYFYKHPKNPSRINANLLAVQFCGHGERLGDSLPDVSCAFTPVKVTGEHPGGTLESNYSNPFDDIPF